MLDPRHLVCPRDKQPFSFGDTTLTCKAGHIYPIVRGIPVLLVAEAPETHGACGTSQQRAIKQNDLMEDDWRPSTDDPVHPAVQVMVAAAGGSSYKDLIGRLHAYPIPEIRLPSGFGKRLLDIGCNWGRWTIAAARKGYQVTGIDPDLGAVLTARRVAQQLGVEAEFVVADARFLPFPRGSYDQVFSYSVLQHLSKQNVELALREVATVLSDEGGALIQMPNRLGLRSAYQQLRRIGKARGIFHVRYWIPWELKRTFNQLIGPSQISADGYFGLGIQPRDRDFIPRPLHAVLAASELMREASLHFAPLLLVADSLYLSARKTRARMHWM